MRKFFFIIAFLLLAGHAWAATYYVNQTGGSDSANGTSTGTAWKTISKVNGSSFSAGDSILLKRGEIWREQLTPPSSGIAGNPITFGAYGSGVAPIIYGRDVRIVNITKQYITFNGITFDGTSVPYEGIKLVTGSSYIIIENCTIRNSSSSGVFIRGDSTGNTIRNNVFTNNGTDSLSHNMYIEGTNNVVEHNEMSGSIGWGIQVYSSVTATNNNIVRYNYVHNNGAAGRGGGIVLEKGAGSMAYYNIVVSNEYGIFVDYNSSGTGVYNNTVVNSVADGITLGSGDSTATVRNNIVIGSGASNYLCDGCSSPTQDHNLLGTNPLFLSSSDYRLQSSSPAINGGVGIAGLMSDYSGNAIKGLPDIGAYEFQGSVDVPKKPTTPSNLTIE